MKILIIGNGFDLAHDLPTKYTDFLDLCDAISSDIKPEFSTQQLYRDFHSKVKTDTYLKFKQLVSNNAWVEFFKRKRSLIGNKWIDFESEIQFVIMTIIDSQKSSNNDLFSGVSVIAPISRILHDKYSSSKMTYKIAFDYLNNELKELSCALDIYFGEYINSIKPEQQNIFKKLNINRLLSFNYTTIYTEIYDIYKHDDFEYCYIHGKAGSSIKGIDTNLVLGYDDHYMEDGKAILETVPFEKYYQRIIKRTDNTYFQWIEEIQSSKDQVELHIYGHSLTPTDGDILRLFIRNPLVKTIIYFKDENDRADKVANLAIVLGPNELIEFSGGMEPKIVFQKIE